MNYNRKNPYYAYLKERFLLSKPKSTKKTYHISLKVNSDELDFNPGDSIGVCPLNEKKLINKTLHALKIFNPSDNEINILNNFNICIGTKKLIEKIKLNLINSDQIKEIEELLENKTNLNKYLHSNHVWQILEDYPSRISLTDLTNLLRPILPRFYSIASSKELIKDEIHLLVAENTYYLKDKLCFGVGSNYLCNLIQINDPVAIYIQKSTHFALPQNPKTPIIMIGPGTGIAPFRAFLQERITKQAFKNWLFFGERNRNYNFYYQDFLKSAQQNNQLRLDLAFSRDQEHKIYVQNLIEQNGASFFEWIKGNAVIYVCGDAKKMAKAVENAILKIIQINGKMSDIESRNYLKELRKNKRYLIDVY